MQAVQQNEPFFHFLKKSLIAHVGIVLFLTLKLALFPSEELNLMDAIRVDLVGLPDKVQSLPQAEPVKIATPPTPSAPETAKKKTAPQAPVKPSVKTKDISKSQQSALDKLKAMKAIEKMKQQAAAKSEPTSRPANNAVKGNTLSQGNSLTGLARVQYNEYLAQLSQHLQSRFAIPSWMEDAGLKAQVLVKIDERGFVIRREIVKSSGNEIFDGQCVAAIDQASPVPAPPSRLAGILESDGMIVNFPRR